MRVEVVKYYCDGCKKETKLDQIGIGSVQLDGVSYDLCETCRDVLLRQLTAPVPELSEEQSAEASIENQEEEIQSAELSESKTLSVPVTRRNIVDDDTKRRIIAAKYTRSPAPTGKALSEEFGISDSYVSLILKSFCDMEAIQGLELEAKQAEEKVPYPGCTFTKIRALKQAGWKRVEIANELRMDGFKTNFATIDEAIKRAMAYEPPARTED